MIKINPYLNFDGNTEEAFNFYKSVFGGEFSSMMKFKDMPEDPNYVVADEEREKIVHISLPIGNEVLMGSDVPAEMMGKFVIGNNTYISVHPDTIEEGRRIFDALSEGGEIEMNFEVQFWGDHFGSFKDKFGVFWMVNVANSV